MNDTGYEGGNNLIGYDANGNMIDMLDKGIESVQYNHLNLPKNFQFMPTSVFGVTNYINLSYLYRADGTKLRKIYSTRLDGRNQPSNNTITDYLDGFHYNLSETVAPCDWCRTEFAFEEQAYQKRDIIFDPGGGIKPPLAPIWRLNFVPTTEGFYSFAENRYIYQYKDHLGTARLSYAKKLDGSLEITDKNDYYPFGLNHIGGLKSNLGGYYNYKYNGKELQETGMYDYGARMYMPDLGRWGVIDNKAEKYFPYSGYNYAINNPIKYLDPDGNDIIIWYKASNGKMESYDYKYGSNYTGKNKYVIAFHNAANYLIKNGAGENLKALDSRKEKVKVTNMGYTDNVGAQFDNIDTIIWNPIKGIESKNTGKRLSPVAVLDHEMDHAEDYFKDPEKHMLNVLKPTGDSYHNAEEMRVIQGSEQSTAKKLKLTKGKEVTRNDHEGDIITTVGVTSTRKPNEIQEVVLTPKKKND
ncbi:RHS repeat-associated core domain-containing protein [Chryseobacterium sp. CFBP8996]|uniref:RHS repeat-associated core domain-containing protein n=1 Tax=Chryseobacterium sp. CFBP8996 TaxID=3096529 RepID=UPI002A6A4228|nr:RHS repeat-associated core domain-containing protein [Chryseobacterium sp. CFBP8996]MDY0930764.1 RHS repeat-associated core domain-containing protein [Chryseobacterium sp. CFBP8996]